jgi:hypothetical protein
MELLGDLRHVEASFGPFVDGPFVHLEIVLILTVEGAHFALNVPLAQNSFWTHLMELLGDVGHLESHFGPFGDSTSVGAR